MNTLGGRTGSLAGRLLTAEAMVIGAMAVTMTVVAVLVGPPVFHEHMGQAGHGDPASMVAHAEMAFRSAGMISLGVGILSATIGAFLISVLITRRIGGSLTAAGRAADLLSQGRYDARVPDPGLGTELATLSRAFNHMAARLESTEATRRRLLTDLAHEMRTPLAAIDVCLEGLEDGVLPADGTTYRTLRQQTDRLTRLTDDIRAVSVADEGRLELTPSVVRVRDLLDQAADASREAYQRKGVGLAATEPAAGDEGLNVMVDPARIGQVLGNLLSNALRHTPPGGSVRLTVAPVRDRVEVSVADDGDGIPPEALDHVFERFYRVDTARDREHGGTGVGLTISAAIARAHGGSLTVRSDGLGHGSTFTLGLPRHDADRG